MSIIQNNIISVFFSACEGEGSGWVLERENHLAADTQGTFLRPRVYWGHEYISSNRILSTLDLTGNLLDNYDLPGGEAWSGKGKEGKQKPKGRLVSYS